MFSIQEYLVYNVPGQTIFQTAGLILIQNRLCRPGIKGRSTDSHAQDFTCPSATALLARTQKSLMTMKKKKKKQNTSNKRGLEKITCNFLNKDGLEGKRGKGTRSSECYSKEKCFGFSR